MEYNEQDKLTSTIDSEAQKHGQVDSCKRGGGRWGLVERR